MKKYQLLKGSTDMSSLKFIERGYPFRARLSGRLDCCHHGFGIRAVNEVFANPEVDSRLRERLQLVIGLDIRMSIPATMRATI